MSEACGSASFQYKPISSRGDEIRIICLSRKDNPHTESNHGTIKCTLEHVSLRDAPKYTALSYVWGDPDITTPVLLNGVPCKVTTNLEAALRQLVNFLKPHDEAKMHLWVDALCIDQANDTEKSQQVLLMRGIYKKAAPVITWLGPASEDSSLAFKTLNRLEYMRSDTRPFKEIRSWPEFQFSATSPLELATKRGLDGLVDRFFHEEPSELSAVLSLFGRAWFRRVWVIQETALAPRAILMCGEDCMYWAHFWEAYWMLMGLRDYLNIVMPHGQESMIAASTLTRSLGNVTAVGFTWLKGDQSLLFLLSLLVTDDDASALQASDERDFVFGLLSLAYDVDDVGVSADYKKSWTEVRHEVAKRCLKHYGLTMLSFCGTHDSSPDEQESSGAVSDICPSWAPDWASKDIPRPLSIRSVMKVRGGMKRSAYGCSGRFIQLIKETHFTSDHGLVASAVRVDDVNQLGNILPVGAYGSTQNPRQTVLIAEWLLQLRDLLPEPNGIYRTHDEVIDAIWRTPIVDRGQVYNYETTRATEELKAGYQELLNSGGKPAQSPGAARYVSIARHKLRRRRPFKTSQGYLGLGSSSTREHDTVWVVLGMDVPLVLRACGNDRWRIIGEAYVHGIMDGGIINNHKKLELTEITII